MMQDLLNTLMDGANNAMLCDCIFHLVDGNLQKLLSDHWYTVLIASLTAFIASAMSFP